MIKSVEKLAMWTPPQYETASKLFH